MTSIFFHGLLLLAGLCSLLPRTQTTDDEKLYDPSIDSLQCRKVALTVCNVSISLYKELAQQSRDGNIFFSPIRVIASILMLSLGAEGNGSQHILEALKLNKTGLSEAEIHKCFQYLLRATNQPTEMSPLTSGSSVFIHQGLKLVDKSMKGIKDLYISEVISTNFRESSKAKAQINHHMMKKTSKEIGTMVKELKNDTFLALMNYIIWNGKIVSYFSCQFVKMEEFHMDHQKTIKVPTINNVGVFHLFRVHDLSSMVLVYSSSQVIPVTYFIIPDHRKMHQVEQRLTYPDFRRMFQQFSLRMVKVQIPRLSVSETHGVESVVNLLGITPVFHKAAISSVVMEDTAQKSFKVASKAMLTLDGKETRPSPSSCFKSDQWADIPLFQLNRPFLIFVQDPANSAPLFLGRVANPRK
ncbi:alpha-1-antitrypsin 1-6-like [Arvicola amphibius]|uniref:alpha-1-antitrypsin 1-6-like n=1 Tax=Arvicola amphibius TaxID=1047088 RepID=UPI0018E2C1C6|nr:alpha-1-antitrypsin 1-6-like [Arvicola amphibius]XP_038193733.1 alpha-1-antitrypsin 1-6-like [Arvicola amphibius]